MGGAGPDGITYSLASGLLGYTPDTLLDEVVDAFAAGDGSAVFGVVDKVIETGQDPRRFTEDLLRRLRDLVIVSAVPDAPATGLIDIAEDAADRLVAQAARFGPAELSRAADLVATGLTEMRGATAPRLLLELICARVLLPGADHSTEGVMARLDRLERRMTISGGDPSPAPTARSEPASVTPAPDIVEQTANEPVRQRPAGADCPGRGGAAEPEPRAGCSGVRRDHHSGRLHADPGRRTPALARHRRGHQATPSPDLDLPHPAGPGRRRRRHDADARVRQRRRPRLLRQRGQRRDRAPGRHRRRRSRLAGRDHRRSRRRAPRRLHRRPAALPRRPGRPRRRSDPSWGRRRRPSRAPPSRPTRHRPRPRPRPIQHHPPRGRRHPPARRSRRPRVAEAPTRRRPSPLTPTAAPGTTTPTRRPPASTGPSSSRRPWARRSSTRSPTSDGPAPPSPASPESAESDR